MPWMVMESLCGLGLVSLLVCIHAHIMCVFVRRSELVYVLNQRRQRSHFLSRLLLFHCWFRSLRLSSSWVHAICVNCVCTYMWLKLFVCLTLVSHSTYSTIMAWSIHRAKRMSCTFAHWEPWIGIFLVYRDIQLSHFLSLSFLIHSWFHTLVVSLWIRSICMPFSSG